MKYHNGFELSPEQAAIGEMALAGAKTGESLKIFAYAGAGKTTWARTTGKAEKFRIFPFKINNYLVDHIT